MSVRHVDSLDAQAACNGSARTLPFRAVLLFLIRGAARLRGSSTRVGSLICCKGCWCSQANMRYWTLPIASKQIDNIEGIPPSPRKGSTLSISGVGEQHGRELERR